MFRPIPKKDDRFDNGYPDLLDHSNYMSKVLTVELYNKLSKLKTSNGYTLDHAIQTGVDNHGHPNFMTAGCVAGDEVGYFLYFFTCKMNKTFIKAMHDLKIIAQEKYCMKNTN